MKKIFVAALTVALTAAFALPASAFESEFGGYWRTRAYTQKNFTGDDTASETQTDSRTRLYYTAKFNDNFKFVNKFEFDTVWGDNATGDVGSDGKEFEIKNSYVDFTTGDMNFKVGTQGTVIARGFMFDDDFSGVVATYNAGKVSVPFMWMKIDEELVDNQNERDYYAVAPVFNLSETLTVNPYFLVDKTEGTDAEMYYLGADVDMKIADASVWATLILGSGDTVVANQKLDTFGYLLAAGANAGMLHTQFFIASGDDDSNDKDNDAFVNPAGRSYYWSEIMGYGIFDNKTSADSPEDGISNVIAINAGVTVKPMDKLTVSGDIWFAQLAEEVNNEDQLGTELDVKATYAVMDNLNLDLVAAYLIAGDATGGGDEDPYELGTRLSFSF